ncbi:ParB/RepB/Spo0J family partition protein [Corynebacterium epidermidicanis]|uniref:Chromosome segregation DNA-binding protein n=1 Tax=Corynebacterium epidermidicanis TaxID=1050174 RepID=A0A0G3GZT6_9CORY|nr:ParB/RepB/Spo0J family partition protein [Corynebacterium epidermidicanis]AKK04357.1 chromosome segregation DNA-binding protein [Corynebacterium epidermidicanis]
MSQETRKGGLGRGLAALIPSSPEQKPRLTNGAADIILGGNKTPHPGTPATTSEAGASQSSAEIGASYREIPVHLIDANPHQPRQVFDPDALDELVHSIREFGLLQPIVVRPRGQRYELIMGERRWRATQRAGLNSIPAIVRETDDADMLRDALLENIHRAQLNPLEEAAAYQQLLQEFNVTQTELADRLGRSRPLITNMIRLLSLPVPVQRKVAAGVLSAGHARALLGLKTGAEAQEALAARIVAEGMSVRATEEAVTLLNRGEAPVERKRVKAPLPEFATQAATRLGDRFDTRVQVQMGKRKGKIVVEFGDHEDFERILGLLEG